MKKQKELTFEEFKELNIAGIFTLRYHRTKEGNYQQTYTPAEFEQMQGWLSRALDECIQSKIKEALAQPEQEPVALETVYETIIQWDEGGGKRSRRELARRIVSLYTTPPQRKPLTDEEIMNIAKVSCIGISPHEDTLNFAKVIEAVHGIKEKNT